MALSPLQRHLGRGTWPPQGVSRRWYDAAIHQALANTDYNAVYGEAQAAGLAPQSMRERHIMLPVAQMITQVSATLVCGGPISFDAADEADQQRLDEIARSNKLSSLVTNAAQQMSAIGGVYARVYINDSTPLGRQVPRVELIPETRAIPTFSGSELISVEFVTEYAHPEASRVLRLFERYELNGITYRVSLGTNTELGKPVPVAEWAQADAAWPYADERATELTVPLVPNLLLATYIPNGTAQNGPLGKSDLAGIEQLLMSIDAAFTTSLDSYQASAPVVAVDDALIDGNGQLPPGVKVMPSRLAAPGEGGKPMEMFQGSFNSGDHIAYLDHLVDTALSLAGISPASLGRGIQGAVSGTALRLRMYQSLAQASVKREALAEGMAQVLRAAAILDTQAYGAKPAVQWANPEGLPTVKLSDGLPVDQLEAAQTAATMLTAGTASQETAIKIAQPTLSDEQVTQEAERIAADQSASINGAVNNALGGVQPLTLNDLTA